MKLFSRESVIKKKAVEIDHTPKRLDVYTEFLPEVFLTPREEGPEGAYYNDLRKAFVETLVAGEGDPENSRQLTDNTFGNAEEFSVHGPGADPSLISLDSGQGGLASGQISPALAQADLVSDQTSSGFGQAGSIPGQTGEHGAEQDNHILAEARKEAEAMIEEAHVQAKKILVAQQKEGELQQKALEDLRQEALTEAMEEGRELGRREGQEEMEEGIRQVRGFYNMLERVWYDVLAGVDKDLLELALKISERIIGTVLKYDKEKLLNMLRSLILLPNERRNLKILVSEADWEWLRSLENKGLPPYPLVRDEGLKPGNVLIQSNEGIFDAQLETQLDKFREVLSEELINGQLESFGPKSQQH